MAVVSATSDLMCTRMDRCRDADSGLVDATGGGDDFAVAAQTGEEGTVLWVLELSDNLVTQLRFAAPQTPQIVEQDLDDVVLITPGLARCVRRDQDMLHCPKRRTRD